MITKTFRYFHESVRTGGWKLMISLKQLICINIEKYKSIILLATQNELHNQVRL